MYERFTGRAEGAQCQSNLFVIGEKAEAYPDLIKKIQDDGHIIGNHSYTHVNLGILSKKDACEQIRKTNDVIYQITGEYPQFCVLLSEAPRRIWTVR